jgi:hypothetical protein
MRMTWANPPQRGGIPADRPAVTTLTNRSLLVRGAAGAYRIPRSKRFDSEAGPVRHDVGKLPHRSVTTTSKRFDFATLSP